MTRLLPVRFILFGAALLSMAFSDSVGLPENDLILVDGWGRGQEESSFEGLLDHFRDAGWDLDRIHYLDFDDPFGSNVTHAGEISNFAESLCRGQEGCTLDFVTCSMGALSTRYFVKALDGLSRVKRLVMVCPPHHGSLIAPFLEGDGAREMEIGSLFLEELNAGDETPGWVEYTSVWSMEDMIVDPVESAILTGAQNIRSTGTHGVDEASFGPIEDALATDAYPQVLATAGKTKTVAIGRQAAFDGSASFGFGKRYAWDFDIDVDLDEDGIYDNDTEAEGAVASHAYEEIGKYIATLTVHDAFGNVDTDIVFVNVKEFVCFMSLALAESR